MSYQRVSICTSTYFTICGHPKIVNESSGFGDMMVKTTMINYNVFEYKYIDVVLLNTSNYGV